MTVYLLSIAVVGVVATQVGGAIGTEELQTQGQVALSVLWAVLGLAAFVAGLRLEIPDLRHGGLALLALQRPRSSCSTWRRSTSPIG